MVSHEISQPNQTELSPNAQSVVEQLRDNGFYYIPAYDGAPPTYSPDFVATNAGENLALTRDSNCTAAALGDIDQTLSGRGEPAPEAILVVESIAAKRPTFVPIDPTILSPDVQNAALVFSAERAGLIVNLSHATGPMFAPTGRVDTFPAIQKEGKSFRVLQTKHVEGEGLSADALEHAMSLLTFPSEVHQTGDVIQAAVEFVEGAERPKTITQDEMDDWLDRVRQSGVSMGEDMAEDDPSLDNLLRYQGRLYWCDGDIVFAKPVPPDDPEVTVRDHAAVLQHFLQQPE